MPLVRVPRTLPKILSPAEVDRLLGALRTHRDRAMVLAMVLGGLRRCEVLGLRLERRAGSVNAACSSPKARAAITGWCRWRTGSSPPSATTSTTNARTASTDRLFVVLKGPRRGQPLSAEGVDEILDGARRRAGLEHGTCHELRHTCLTRLREAGMALEAVQAQAGHRSIESTRIYLHLTNDWLAGEYQRAASLIDADQAAVAEMLAIQEVVR